MTAASKAKHVHDRRLVIFPVVTGCGSVLGQWYCTKCDWTEGYQYDF